MRTWRLLGAHCTATSTVRTIGVSPLASTLHVCFNCQQRATEDVRVARQRGITIGELRARLLGGRYALRTLPTGVAESTAHWDSAHSALSLSRALPTPPPLNAAIYRRGSGWDNEDEIDNTEGGRGTVDRRSRGSFGGPVDETPIAECRDKSTSAWLHFPHVELLFLFFAFEGAVASQASAIRHVGVGCPSVFATAVLTLVRLLWRTKYNNHALSIAPKTELHAQKQARGACV